MKLHLEQIEELGKIMIRGTESLNIILLFSILLLFSYFLNMRLFFVGAIIYGILLFIFNSWRYAKWKKLNMKK